MLDIDEAARKVAAASHHLRQVREARTLPDSRAVKSAERRLTMLLRLCRCFKNDPAFTKACDREMRALANGH